MILQAKLSDSSYALKSNYGIVSEGRFKPLPLLSLYHYAARVWSMIHCTLVSCSRTEIIEKKHTRSTEIFHLEEDITAKSTKC